MLVFRVSCTLCASTFCPCENWIIYTLQNFVNRMSQGVVSHGWRLKYPKIIGGLLRILFTAVDPA